MTPEDGIRNQQHQVRDAAADTASARSALPGRILENLAHIFQLELRLLESRITLSLTEMVNHALAGLVVLFASAVGGCCLLTALIMVLHQWLLWWQNLAIGGGMAIATGAIAHASLSRSAPQA